METKRCCKCGRELPLSEFYKNKWMKDGLTRQCKHCYKEHQRSAEYKAWRKENYKKNREKILDRNRECRRRRYRKMKDIGRPIIPEGVFTKICTCCGKELPLENFAKSLLHKYGRDCMCKNCSAEYHKQYVKEHKDRQIEIKKRFFRSEKGKVSRKRFMNSDSYFIGRLYASGFPKESITPDLIAFKRAHLQLKREIKAQESQEPNNNN